MTGDFLAFNPTIDLGQVATMAVALMGGTWALGAMRGDVKGVKSDIARFDRRLDRVDNELRKQTQILVSLGEQGARLANLESEVARLRLAKE